MFGDPLLIDKETLSRRRLDRTKNLISIPFGHSCLEKIRVKYRRKTFTMSVVEDRSPVDFSWVEELLGLRKLYYQANSKNFTEE